MPPGTFHRLLGEALDLPEQDRPRWLDSLAPEYAAFEPRLRRILSRQPADSFLRTIPKVDSSSAESDHAGGAAGPYRLLRKLAEGGMGTVWLAERDDGMARRPVAVKFPRQTWEGEILAERLAREREILAALNHPNIARLYDAGVTGDGRPYLALEYVEGLHIDQHCEAHHLDVRSRLKLFLQVTGAVTSAHAKLVVHRDLKPSNILVTGAGQVKLLDFGIAKLIEDAQSEETELTRLGGRALTPHYAAPEQIAGHPVGTAADIYSLGVVLYRLLTGSQPYQLNRDSRAALEDAILQQDPLPPSEATEERSVRKALRGDLDTIILHALKKDPDQRYASVTAFSEDIERYLSGLPVLAHPISHSYRLRKFVKRNLLAVCAAIAVALAVAGGTAAAVWQARVAISEKQRAEEVKEFLVATLQGADPYSDNGKALSAVELLKQASGKIERNLAGRPELQVELLNILGWSLVNHRETAAAEIVVNQALKESRRLEQNDPQSLRARVLQAVVHRYRGRTREMREELDRLLPALRKHGDRSRLDLIRALRNNANLLLHEGRYGPAAEAAREALSLAASAYGERHFETATSWHVLALAYVYANDAGPALDAARHAYQLTEQLRGGNVRHPQVIEVRAIYGRALAIAGRGPEALEELEQTMAAAREVFGPMGYAVGVASHYLALTQLELGQAKAALENASRACQIIARHAKRDSYLHAKQVHTRGRALFANHRYGEATTDFSDAVATFREILGQGHSVTKTALIDYALALDYSGRASEGRRELPFPKVKSRGRLLAVADSDGSERIP